jgi:hypothetical protein
VDAANHSAGARTNWLGGRANADTDVKAALDKVITDLSAQLTGDDGAERIGAFQVVSSGSFGTVATGSVSSQLTNLINNAGHLTNPNVWAGAQTFQNGIILNTLDPFTIASPANIDLNWNMNQGDWILAFAGSTTDSFQITNGTNKVFEFIKSSTGNHGLYLGSNGAGVADAYAATPFDFGSPTPSSLQPKGLRIKPAGSGGTGAPLILEVGGEDTAGTYPGSLTINFQVNEGNGGRRVYLPTLTYALQDSGPAQILDTENGASLIQTRGTLNNSAIMIEAYVFGLGWNAGSPVNGLSWVGKRRASGMRDNTGTYSITSAVADVFTYDNLTPTTPPAVTIVANATGFHIQVTPGAEVVPQDQLWWGYLVISPFEFNDPPDVDLT